MKHETPSAVTLAQDADATPVPRGPTNDVTERQQADEALRESAQQFRILFDQAADGMMLADAETTRITLSNRQMRRQLGYSEGEILQLTVSDLHAAADLPAMLMQFETLARGAVTLVPNAPVRRKDGTTFYADISGAAVRFQQRDCLLGIFRDVTERKQAEDALKQSEDKFRYVFDHSPVGKSLTLPTGEVRVNRAFGDMLGYSVDELRQKTWQELSHPDDTETTQREIDAVLAGDKETAHFIKRYVKKDGSIVWAEVSTSLRRDSAGVPIYFMTVVYDITGRKLAENALRDSEERFRQLSESLPQLVWTCRGDGSCDYLSPQWVEYTGIPEAEQLGFAWLEQLHPDDRDRTVAAWQAAVDASTNFDVEFRIRRHDGAYRWFRTLAVAFRDAEGRIAKWFGSNTDIDDLRQAQDDLRTLNVDLEQRVRGRTAQLEASNKDLEAFSYSVSHDLRAPLRAIDGFGRILKEDYESHLDAEGQRLLGVIASETQRMGHLIDDLLAFSRLGRQMMASSHIDMTALARAVFDEQAARVPERILHLDLKPLPPAQGDPGLIRIVLGNLLSNAVKFTRSRDPAVIEMGTLKQDGQMAYYVKDNGIGFDMTYADKLFKVFQRLHSTEAFEGTGVGLALAQRVVHRHGGRIWAEGKVNEGAVFAFSLPDQKEAQP